MGFPEDADVKAPRGFSFFLWSFFILIIHKRERVVMK